MGKVARGLGHVNKLLTLISGIIVTVFIVLVIYDILRRTFSLDIPKGWSVELGEVFLLLMTYLPVAYILSKGRHVQVGILANRLSGKGDVTMYTVVRLFIIFYGIIMVWAGGILSWDYTLIRKETTMAVPLYPAVFLIPIGGLLLATEAFAQVYLRFRE